MALIALSERGRINLGSMVEDTCRPEDAPEVYKAADKFAVLPDNAVQLELTQYIREE